MDLGDTVNAGGYSFRFNGITNIAGPNYQAARAEIEVSKNGNVINKMYPEKRTYVASGNVMTETAIDTGLFRDLYISLGEPVSGGAWSVVLAVPRSAISSQQMRIAAHCTAIWIV